MYARIQDAVIVEMITPVTWGIDSPEGIKPPYKAADEVPLADRFNAALIDGTISWIVEITSVEPAPDVGWSATQMGGVWHFTAPLDG